jgi:uncharacterized protein (TIGR00369 family)
VQQPGQAVNPLFARLGVEVLRLEEDGVELALPLAPDLVQGAGVVAGGIVATLLDEAMAHAVMAGLPDAASTATAEMSVRYLRPVPAPGEGEAPRLMARARALHRGRRVVTAEAEAFQDPDRLNAVAQATFLVI